MRYTIEPLIISRHRWYCKTLSAESETKAVQKTSHLDYRNMKVVELKAICRDKGLPVSGIKAELLKRIEKSLNDEKENDDDFNENSHEDVSAQPDLFDHDDSVTDTSRYLRDLIEEYLQAKGGIACSRMVGRYLAASKANNDNMINALGELKTVYGSLNAFVSQNLDIFAIRKENSKTGTNDDNDTTDAVVTGSYEFSVVLRRRIS
jgi:hypothetical protein